MKADDLTKGCALCSRMLPLGDFYRRGTGRHAYCKLCHRDRTYELRDARAAGVKAEPLRSGA